MKSVEDDLVLVIESEPWLGDHYQRQLEDQGFLVARASHAYAAIDRVNENPPSVIIMSLLLDGPGALNLLHELQSYKDTSNIPIIVCSSMSNLDLDELQPYGVRRIINSISMKPDDIVTAVRSVTV